LKLNKLGCFANHDKAGCIYADISIGLIFTYMAIEHEVLSTLASIPEVISPPPMLSMVLSSVFTETKCPAQEQEPETFNPNITIRMLRAADLSSMAAPETSDNKNSDYSAAKSLVLSLSIYNQLVDRGFTQDSHFKMKWQRFLEIANASQHIASLYNPALVEKAYIAGLLHDFGRICLHRYFPEEAALALSCMSSNESEQNVS
jgi:hypothetical protein